VVGETYPLNIELELKETTLTELVYHLHDESTLPPGLKLDCSGQIYGIPATPGNFTFNITATDSEGSQAPVTVNSGPVGIIVAECTDSFTCTGHGACNGGDNAADGIYTCDCATEWTGDKCEVANVEESMLESEQVGGILGGVIASIFLALGLVKYRNFVISRRPIDFDTQFALMVSMGLIEPEQAKLKLYPREIRRRDLTLVKVIGSGAFGEVYKAQLDETHTRDAPEYTVAAKTVLDAKASPEATQEMLNEAGVMAAVGSHPNLVTIIGVVTRGDPFILIIQFCAQGELLGSLKKAAAEGEPMSLLDKMQMCREIVQGMAHLSKQHFIHRDLACRNVLLSEGMCKIADFGLSRGAGEGDAKEDDGAATHEDYYKSTAGVFPVRWTAPEAMETLRFTPASDVWSFGIVVIEMLTNGVSPYHGMSNPAVMKLTLSGGRHEKPPLCSNKLYNVLLQCWDADASKRPTFADLKVTFKDMYTVSSTGADANAARVEAATLDKLQRGEAANEYTSFGFGGDFGMEVEDCTHLGNCTCPNCGEEDANGGEDGCECQWHHQAQRVQAL
jgi:hypothetical protein